jgi:hypothetical protein
MGFLIVRNGNEQWLLGLSVDDGVAVSVKLDQSAIVLEADATVILEPGSESLALVLCLGGHLAHMPGLVDFVSFLSVSPCVKLANLEVVFFGVLHGGNLLSMVVGVFP